MNETSNDPSSVGSTANRPTSPTGYFGDTLPYLRVGELDAPEQVVVIPGVGDAFYDRDYLQAHGWPLRSLVERSYQPYVTGRTIWIVGRPRGLDESVTTSALASLYYEHVISTLGRVTIRGESMGGMIAQHLALQHPSHVARLILVATGYRISDYAAGAMHRWELLARNLAWDDLYLDMARELYAGWRDEVPKHYDALASAFGLRHHPADPHDFLVSLRACREHNTRSSLPLIECPTFIICGTDDALFTVDIQETMANDISGASLHLMPGVAHGVYLEKKREFDLALLAYLDSEQR